MAKVVVACGAGVATSHAVAKRIEGLLAERGVKAEVCAVSMAHLDAALEGADAYVAVVKDDRSYDVPTINGVAFLTGMGQDVELARLIEALR